MSGEALILFEVLLVVVILGWAIREVLSVRKPRRRSRDDDC